MDDVCLMDKTCVPCHGGIPPMDGESAKKMLSELGGGWQINGAGHLYKQFKFNDFMGPIGLANKIAAVAEEQAHHPDLTIAWGSCSVEIWTHKISGLAESDFILAAKIDGLVDSNKTLA